MTTTITTKSSFNAMKNDLLTAWELRNETVNGEEKCLVKKIANSSNFIYSIDPENLARLKFFFNHLATGSDSLASFARKVISNKIQFN